MRYNLKSMGKEEIEIDGVLNTITKIEPRIHGFNCSCKTHFMKFPFSSDDFDEEMTPVQVAKRTKKYRQGLILNWVDRKFYVLYNQRKGKRATGFYISVSEPTPFHLLMLIDKFKKLNVSSVEYAIDLFCSSPEEVNNLYYLIKKYLLLKRNQNKFIRVEEADQDINYTCYLDSVVKFYGRGDNNDKIDGIGWLYKDLNRVRLEFTAKRYYLKKILKINNINSMINNCRFSELINYLFSNRLMFMKIGSSNDDIQYDFLANYKAANNLKFRNLIRVGQFNSLINDISLGAKSFNENWQNEAKDYRKIMRLS